MKKNTTLLILILLALVLITFWFISRFLKSKTENVEISKTEDLDVEEHQKIILPILMYHHIRVYQDNKDKIYKELSVSPKDLEEQMAYLAKEKYQTVSLNQLIAFLEKGKRLKDRPIILTFDDGYKDFYENAYPILKKYNKKASLFIITNKVGANNYLTWSEIQELAQNGFEIGSHTKNHPDLTKISSEKTKIEIEESKKTLEEKLGQKIKVFGYPAGKFNEKIEKMVKEAGYQGAVSINQGKEQTDDSIFLLKRIKVGGSEDIETFKSEIEEKK